MRELLKAEYREPKILVTDSGLSRVERPGSTFRLNNVVTVWLVIIFCIQTMVAQENKKPSWFDSVTLNGFVSTAFVYNTNLPANLQNQFHIFDFDDQSFKVDVVELSLKKDAPAISDVGFRVDLTAGSSVPRIARSSGLNIGDIDFHQVYFSYVAPLGNGLKFDLGKFITPLGYEVIEGYDGYNDNYSRSLLFGYAIPFTHTGVKASYTFNENISGSIMLVNGWDNAVDSNNYKSIGAQVSITPTAGLNIISGIIYGPEKSRNTSDNRTIIDVVAMYAISNQFTLGVNFDYGSEQHSSLTNETAVWLGIAGYLRYNACKNLSLALRAEQFEDNDGVRTTVLQILREMTLTGEYRVNDNFILRTDLRIDNSNQDVFQNRSDYKNTQSLIGVNAIFLF